MNRISAKVVADSISDTNDRITTLELVFPRFILAEFNTHRLFSRNSASSRAIPFKKMLKSVKTEPFIPIAWQKDHSGMQGTEYHEGFRVKLNNFGWRLASRFAMLSARILNKFNVTKQLCNRILEPFLYHKVLVTATEWDNFFKLRCPQYQLMDESGNWTEESGAKSKIEWCKIMNSRSFVDCIHNMEDYQNPMDWLKINKGQGEIHIMDLAEKIYDAINESTPKKLQPGEWHIPYNDNLFTSGEFYEFFLENTDDQWVNADMHDDALDKMACKIAIARCARLSYQTLGDNPKIDYKADLKLFNILKESGHFSPFEHVARCMNSIEYKGCIKANPVSNSIPYMEDSKAMGWCLNFKGFIQYRALLEN